MNTQTDVTEASTSCDCSTALSSAMDTVGFWLHQWADEQADVDDPSGCDLTERDVIRAGNTVLSALRRLVDAIPHTADGVPVIPGMTIWPPIFIDGEEGATIKVVAVDKVTGDTVEHGTEGLRIGVCFSSREAAEASQ